MPTRANSALIGLATLAILAALFGFGYWFGRGPSDIIDVKLVFNGKVSGLGRGSSVLFNGLRVGEVRDIEIAPDNPRQIHAVIKISSSAPLRVDTTARLEGQGLAGIVAVQLRGGKPDAAPLTAAPGQALPTITADTSESIFEMVESVAKRVDETLVGMDEAIQANSRPISEKIKSVESLSETLDGDASKVDQFMKSVGSMAEFIAPLPEKLKAFSDGFLEDIRSIEKSRIASVIENADRVTANLREVAPNVREAAENVASMSAKLNRAADQVDGVLSGAQSFLTGAANENGHSFFEDVSEAAKSLRLLADNLDRSTAAATAKIIQFAGGRLQDVEKLTSNGGRSLTRFERVLRGVNRDPQGLIFGSKDRLPRYGGTR